MSEGTLAIVGDVHLDLGDAEVPEFLSFLDKLPGRVGRLVLMGDLFNLWIGSLDLEQAHHAEVAKALAALRRRGIVVRYLEGNRDYRVGACYSGSALDDASEHGIVETVAGKRLFAVHGDLANVADRRYRLWRRASRSLPAWWLFRMIPRRRRRRWVDRLEMRMRSSNVAFKGAFPEGAVRDYAAGFFREGYDAVVLGHFHVEKNLAVESGGGAGRRILVLPEWKGSRRHLEVGPDGRIEFVDSQY